MAASVSRMDALVKEYLLYRGFHSTLKVMENEYKNEKEKGYRVDKIMEQLNYYITTFDLASVRDYWAFLDQRLFSHLELLYASAVRKLEISVLKMYLVNAIQSNKQDKVTEFFEKMVPELQTQPEWKEWFVLPFVKNPEDNSQFSMYFTKQWQDTLLLSLHNFLSVVIQNMPMPAIMSYEEDQRRIIRLQEETKRCQELVRALSERRATETSTSTLQPGSSEPQSPCDMMPGAGSMGLMDDFYVISQETTIPEKPQQPPKSQQIRSFIKNIGLPSSPIASKKMISAPVASGTSTGMTGAAQASKKVPAVQPIGATKEDSSRKLNKDASAVRKTKAQVPQTGGACAFAAGPPAAPLSGRAEQSGRTNTGEATGIKEDVKSLAGVKSKEKVG